MCLLQLPFPGISLKHLCKYLKVLVIRVKSLIEVTLCARAVWRKPAKGKKSFKKHLSQMLYSLQIKSNLSVLSVSRFMHL